jgi:hypothetical protein
MLVVVSFLEIVNKEVNPMKKIIFFAIIMLAAAALVMPQAASAAGSWAEGTYTLGDGGGNASSNATYQLSSNVFLWYTADSTNTAYGLGSLHQSGNRSYCTTNNTTLIYWNDKSVGNTSDGNAEPTAGTTTPTGTAL